MITSILFGASHSLLILIGGWLRLLFSFISLRLGNGIPTLYFFLGVAFGIGEYYQPLSSYWIVYLSGMIFSFLMTLWSSSFDRKRGETENGTVTNCGAGFVFGGIMGMLLNLFVL